MAPLKLSSYCCLVAIVAACSSPDDGLGDLGAGGQVASGGTAGRPAGTTGGSTALGGTTGSGSGGSTTGGTTAGGRGGSGGGFGVGGADASGRGGQGAGQGGTGFGGAPGAGGTDAAGTSGRGGGLFGGRPGFGGAGLGGRGSGGGNPGGGMGVGGGTGNGGSSGGGMSTGGASGGSGPTMVDCNAVMPTGGTEHCGQNAQAEAAGQSWSLWSNNLNGNACITTFSTPAFSARWNGNNDFLARLGLEFGNSGKTYDQYGTLKADYVFNKKGDGGGYSYIGVYGWTNSPCVEWYIVDDRFGSMPFNAYNASQKGTAEIDGEQYKLFQNKTNGTGGSRCTGVSQWDQFWSIRQSARHCGTITISDHFKAWEAAGLQLGSLIEAKILVETGGGNGSIEFPVAQVVASQ